MFKQFLNWILFPVVTVLTLTLSPVAQSQEKGTILVLGDSLSSGYNFSPDQTWVALLEQRLGEENINYDVVNSSISGDTTTQGLKRLPKLLEVYKPELVIIELGGNDGLRGFPPNVIKSNLKTLVSKSQKAGAEVLLLGIQIPPNYGEKYAQAFFENYKEIASNSETKLVPFFLDGVGGNEELMQKDGIHPNAKAQPILLDNVWQQLSPMLQK
ncbi:arylesterase [Kangiella sediminilitoris]|nr:arylesterase [Kangiella sediminilitoris]